MKHDCPHCGVPLRFRLLRPFGGWRRLRSDGQACPACGGKVERRQHPAEDQLAYLSVPLILLSVSAVPLVRWVNGATRPAGPVWPVVVGLTLAAVWLLLAHRAYRLRHAIPGDWQRFKSGAD